MLRFSIWSALVLLGALLCLAACAPQATVNGSPTATTPLAPTATTTPAAAPTPTNVPAGWAVLDTSDFSLAYPSDWTPQTIPQQDGSVLYLLTPPNNQPAVSAVVQDHVHDADIRASYCGPVTSNSQHTTLAGLPMTYGISGEGQLDRSWAFVNTQRTVFALDAGDAQSSRVIQAQDDAVLATFRPDDPTPYAC